MKKVFLLIISLFLSFTLFSQSVVPFQAGDRVVFLGNSITDGGRYHSFVWLYYMTHFPERRIQIFNSGISADMVSNMQKRFETDVLPHKPSYIMLTFGMNDSGYSGYDKPDGAAYGEKMYQDAVENYKAMETKLKAYRKAKVGIMSSSPYDENVELPDNPASKAHKGKLDVMLKIADFQKEQAEKNAWGFVDITRPMAEINVKGQEKDPSFTISGGDRVHPGNLGHMVMAYLFLKAQGFAGEKVADIVIDAKERKAIISENCKISAVKNNDGKLSFNYLAKSLPYPTDTLHLWGSASQHEALDLVPFVKDMNEEKLRIKGLSDGEYELKIDNELIGKFSMRELSNGINLATYSNTPQYQQALSVMHLNEERWEIERRLRQYKGLHYRYLEGKGLLLEDSRKTLDQLQSELNTHYILPHLYPNYTKARFEEIRKTWEAMQELLVDRIYSINKPIERSIEIIKIEQ